MYYPMFYDPTYILVMIGVVICLLASAKMNSTFSKYSRVRSHSGMTGKEAAEALLHREGIYDVRVEYVAGNLTDHYDPRSKSTSFIRCNLPADIGCSNQELQLMNVVMRSSMQEDMHRCLSVVRLYRLLILEVRSPGRLSSSD